MAKIQIKSEQLTPIGGIFPIMEQFDSTLSSVIDSTLGLRCRLLCCRFSASVTGYGYAVGGHPRLVKNVAHTAMLLFAGYIDAATSMSESCGGGGGSSPESDWGKKDDENERMFARRYLQMAHSMLKPKSIKRGYHR